MAKPKTKAKKKPAPSKAAPKAKRPAAPKQKKAAKKTAPKASKELKTAVQAASALKPGDPAPDFTLAADDGSEVSLSGLRGKRVVLYFYPKDNTPGCTIQACEYRDLQPAFAEKNAIVLGVSRDSAQSHQGFRGRHGLNFPLLVDPDARVHALYGAWGEKNLYGKKIIGAIRTTVVIDEAGRISHWSGGVKAAGNASATLATLS